MEKFDTYTQRPVTREWIVTLDAHGIHSPQYKVTASYDATGACRSVTVRNDKGIPKVPATAATIVHRLLHAMEANDDMGEDYNAAERAYNVLRGVTV